MGDLISRQAAIVALDNRMSSLENVDMQIAMGFAKGIIHDLPSVTPAEKTLQFAEWVAAEIFDDMWEYNKDAFAEIACRKLAKLGIVRAKGDVWELVEKNNIYDEIKWFLEEHPVSELLKIIADVVEWEVENE